MKILVIDDNEQDRKIIERFLKKAGYTEVFLADTGEKGVESAVSEKPDLVITDTMLPGIDGFEVCREIRQFSDVPIVMLTVRNADTDTARALEMGADDYLSKPFSYIELLSRVQAVLRRTQKLPLSKGEGAFSSGGLSIDYDSREVHMGGEKVKLTPYEYGLLYHLTRNAGRVVTYQALVSHVWGENYEQDTYLLKLHIHNLRRKLDDNPQSPKMIINERGVGYKFIRVN